MNFVDFRPLLGKLFSFSFSLGRLIYLTIFPSGNCYVQCGFFVVVREEALPCSILFFCLGYESSFSGHVLLAVLGILESSQNQNMCP